MQTADLVVLWRVFEHCNLTCNFCGYSAAIHRSRIIANVDRVLGFGDILSNYARIRGRRVLVSWLGGEPLLWPELSRISRVFHRDLGMQVSVTSNGSFLDDLRIRTSLVADYCQLTISIDGIGQVHDTIRSAPGLFERIRQGVCSLQADVAAVGSSLRIGVNTILMRGNIAKFEDLCREVAGWGVRELTFNQLGGNERPEYYAANRLLPEQVDRFANELPAIRDRMGRLGLVIRGSPRYLQRLVSTSRGERIPIDDCDPGTSFLFIDEQGRLGPCSFTTEQCNVTLDDIAGPDDVDRLPQLFAYRRRQRFAPCDDCHSTQVFDKFGRNDETAHSCEGVKLGGTRYALRQ